MLIRVGATLLALAAGVPAASAAPKAAVFPFDMIFQTSEEDFFIGPPKPSSEEQQRLVRSRQEIEDRLKASGQVEILDIAPVAADIAGAAPLSKCNGCEMDFARKLGADVLYLGVVEKASATILNMRIIVVDVAKGQPVKDVQAVVQGNTDDAWLGVTRWLTKNRLLASSEAAKPRAPGEAP